MKGDRVPDLLVEQLALGELPPSEAARVREALGERSDNHLQALARDDAEILEQLPPASVAEEVRRRLARVEPTRGGIAMPMWIPALAVAAVAVILWLRLGPGDTPALQDSIARNDPGVEDDTGDVVYIKGDARMWIDRLGPTGPQRLAEGDTVEAGDRLQVHYDAADQALGAIVSIDGRGVVTLHFPGDAATPPTLARGGAVALDHSYELDDAPAFERFFFVTAPGEGDLRVDDVMQAARRLAETPAARTDPLALPGLHQSTILLHKR